MISKAGARAILEQFLNGMYMDGPPGDGIVVNADVVEREYGWLFTYTTAAFRRTGDHRHALVGAGPVAVLRDSGRIITFPSYLSRSQAVAEYEAAPQKFAAGQQ
ncbi:YrhB domain-containing protein [Nonomuraea sp. NPDC049400]|uniref:YrhB domain-containing protein n=1 Tax=Nonomuraea sp. NPDC049400 TaxID=3364352 RepID=UPI00378C0CC7